MPYATTIPARLLAALLLATTVTAAAQPCMAAPSAASVSAAQAALDDAVARRTAAEARAAATAGRVARASAELDRLVAAQNAAQRRLDSHASATYRSGQLSFIELLVRAVDFADFSSRWSLLTRVNESEARTIKQLKAARAKARTAARRLVALQEKQAREARALEAEAARARRTLASSRDAYDEYRRRVRAARTPVRTTTPEPEREQSPPPSATGTGAWRTGVASHYGRNFTGRGASGKRIGPDSMMVAHKTLPFGTLVEFRYNGRTAVASVEDRGPFTPGRDWDLGPGVIRVLGFNGVHKVQYRVIGR